MLRGGVRRGAMLCFIRIKKVMRLGYLDMS